MDRTFLSDDPILFLQGSYQAFGYIVVIDNGCDTGTC